MRAISATMIRNLLQCERRLHHDLHSPSFLRDPVSDFVQMLWNGGIAHEDEVLAGLGGRVLDLRGRSPDERAAATVSAFSQDIDFILGAVVQHDDCQGQPDFLHKKQGRWIAGDIKSGCATERDNCRPRQAYAVQVAFYASILADLEVGDGGQAFVIGRDGTATSYDLDRVCYKVGGVLQSPSSLTSMLTSHARQIRDKGVATRGAISAACKLCHWYTHCATELRAADDLTLVPGVGRAVRDQLAQFAPTVAKLATLDLAPLIKANGRTAVKGLGSERLRRFKERARLLSTPGATPFSRQPLSLPTGKPEIHFDIEADPMRNGFVYLHGFLFREPTADGFHERYEYVFAESLAEEEEAFRQAMSLLTANAEAQIFYYSKYERTSFRALADRFPNVCTREEIDRLFAPARATDLLFDVITPHTEWPTNNHSIKTLARYLGFDWRDTDASGAASIAWFHDYVQTRDKAIKDRILKYNEDDVRASAAVLDGLRALPVTSGPTWPLIGSPKGLHFTSL